MPPKTVQQRGRGRGKPFVEGDARAGRPKGTPNKATAEAKAACAKLVDDPAYRDELALRLIAGKLAPAVECMLWHYAHGKPKEQIELSAGESLIDLLGGDDDPRPSRLPDPPHRFDERGRAVAAGEPPHEEITYSPGGT